MKNLSWRLVVIAAVILTAVIYVIPTFWPGMLHSKKINLGLDLQGGMHLVLEVDADKAVENTLERLRQEMRSLLRKEQIRYQGIERTKAMTLTVGLANATDLTPFKELVEKEFPDLEIAEQLAEESRQVVTLGLPDQEVDQIRKLAVDQALETIRNRIDQFGVSEPDIRVQGERRILIQLPGVKDTQRAKELIGRTAQLEFKLLDEDNDVVAALAGNIPATSEILYENRKGPETGQVKPIPYLVKKRTALTGDYLTDARVAFDNQYNQPYVAISFNKKGARIFERITEENKKKRLAIVLDNHVYSAPAIQDRIAGGEAQITGSFTLDEAKDLAIALRAGALPAPVQILEERTVGPSLGTDSIRMGLLSMCVGGILVICFMAIYYKGAGLLADFALMLNIVLIAGGLAAFGATLTLPGIAGVILTIGMAVDANVLIFERIREEMGLGKTPRAAVDAGYKRATLTILDANVTTLIAALVLFQFGTGPVKGFAVTLSLGVVASLFTALVLSRAIFDLFLVKLKIRTISI